MNMTSMKLPLLLGLALGAAACAPLGQYAAMGGAPAAGAPTTGAPGAAPAAAPAAAPMTGASESSSTAPSTPPSSVSVSIKNSCEKTVKVFFGDKPKFGSGTYSTASSNSRSSHSFAPGDQFWIVDDSQNGVANVAVSESTREIEILGSCDRLAAR
jgi:hypothetical protein